MKKMLGVVGINILMIGFLLFLANVLSIAAIQIFNWQKPKQYAQSHLFPNYADDPEAALLHFTEYDNLTKGYYESYYVWRRPELERQTINISADGLRHTHRPEGALPTKTVAFFGGSTMWGTGAPDDGTIPSLFAKMMPEFEAINFGETGYTAHQSLNLLLRRYYEGFRPEVVVSYDGVNDVWNKCRREHGPYSHNREYEMRTILSEGSADHPESFGFIIQPMRNFAGKVARTLAARRSESAASPYDCHENPEKAEQIARFLLADWAVLKMLVEGYGGTFIAILQPQAYGSETKLDHLDLSETLGEQYAAVYPKVLELLPKEFPELEENFADLRAALDRQDYVYIDWCHLSPNGNATIAERMAGLVKTRAGAAESTLSMVE
ncbi:MAG: SGNH/GDSL hydrolase family protein [Alphaproteobacteria bacterium]|nr:SGNH/GDSL hydrolase family protein [Alphaproteobacteria bacterium]